MHPYIAQIDDVAKRLGRGIFRQWWNTHRVMLGAATVGWVLASFLWYGGFTVIGQILLAFSCVGWIIPMVYFLVTLPIYAAELLDPTAHNEMALNTLRHKAVVWSAHDPSLTEVFAHFKKVFDQADNKTRRHLMILLLSWSTPEGLGDVGLSHEEAKNRFDAMFPNTIEVEADDALSWRALSKKYLRI